MVLGSLEWWMCPYRPSLSLKQGDVLVRRTIMFALLLRHTILFALLLRRTILLCFSDADTQVESQRCPPFGPSPTSCWRAQEVSSLPAYQCFVMPAILSL